MSGDPRRGQGRVEGTLGQVRDGWGNSRLGSGRVERQFWRSGTGRGRGVHPEVRDGSGTIGQVRDGLGDPLGGPGRVKGLSARSGTSRGTHQVVQNELGNIGMLRTNRGTLKEAQDGFVEPQGGLGRVGGPSGRSGTGWGTLREVRDGSGDTPGGLERVRGQSGMSGTG